MAELVDALVLGASEILVWVRVPLPAPLRLRILRDFQTQFLLYRKVGINANNFSHSCGRCILGARFQVGIGSCCGGEVTVSQPLLNLSHGNAVFQQ